MYDYGGPAVLRNGSLLRPEPVAGEVLVQVHAAVVNLVDWRTRSGLAPARLEGGSVRLTSGWDLSGVVAELGSGVTTFAVGDLGFSMNSLLAPVGPTLHMSHPMSIS